MSASDFFISYTANDAEWANWVAWQLEEAHYQVTIQAWDFVPGTNWIAKMQDAVTTSARTIAILSNQYLSNSTFGTAEWQSVWAQDPLGEGRKLIPIIVEPKCPRPGLLAGIVGCDLSELDEIAARDLLLDVARSAIAGRTKPASPPTFPTVRSPGSP